MKIKEETDLPRMSFNENDKGQKSQGVEHTRCFSGQSRGLLVLKGPSADPFPCSV